MKHLRRFLRWLRIEDENGQLSLTTLAFAAGMFCILKGVAVSLADLSAFGLALGAYAHKRYRQQRSTEIAMETAGEAALQKDQQAHELAMNAQSEHVSAVAAKVETLIDHVQKITSPERLQGLKDAFGRKQA